MEVIYVIIAFIVIFAAKGIYDSRVGAKKLRERIIREYGAKADRELDGGRAGSISFYCRSRERSRCPVDDITWNDLDMDRIFYMLDSCKSAIGEEYLYYLLRNPSDDIAELKERNRVIEALAGSAELRTQLGIFLGGIGGIRNISVYEYINRLKDVTTDGIFGHALRALLLAASIGVIFYNPAIGIMVFVAMFFANIIAYFKRKSEIECYYTIFAYIMSLAGAAKGLDRLKAADTEGAIAEYTDRFGKAAKELHSATRGAGFFLNPTGTGDILQSIMDYIRMAFHIDLIFFNITLKKLTKNEASFEELYETVGFLDCMLAAASYREWTGDTCLPELHDGAEGDPVMSFTGLSHPLLEAPVSNSLAPRRPVLLTGSNASGKSTFLKAVAINAILAQSIYTVRAESYSAPCFHVMSSMALQDDLLNAESYFTVEIRSLKRILDTIGEKDGAPVMCFVDEVLRGTNTVERIAASTEILKAFAGAAGMCFVATHDIELTYRLEDVFDNYHFEEKVEDEEVTFDYRIHEGRATTRNAIRLLAMMGFDRSIVDAAMKNAEADRFGGRG